MVVMGVRLPVSHVAVLDLIAAGLGARRGKRVTRGEALRSIVTPVLETALKGQAVLEAVARLQGEMAHIALEGAVANPPQVSPRKTAVDPTTAAANVLDALGGEAAVRAAGRRAVKGRGPREDGPEFGPPPREPSYAERMRASKKRKSRS